MKTENTRTVAVWLVCGLMVALLIDIVIRARYSAPAPAEIQAAAQTNSATVQAETPAPVASESTNTNRVTVDFKGVQPVIK